MISPVSFRAGSAGFCVRFFMPASVEQWVGQVWGKAGDASAFSRTGVCLHHEVFTAILPGLFDLRIRLHGKGIHQDQRGAAA
jgi:hypothetical protein